MADVNVTVIGSADGRKAEATTFRVAVPELRYCRRCRGWFDDEAGAKVEQPKGMMQWRNKLCAPRCEKFPPPAAQSAGRE